MAVPLDGVLTQAQRDSLEIVSFIFHIIEPEADDEDVVFLDEVQLQAKQKEFFLARLREIAEGTQYVFKQDAVHLKEKCQQLVEAPDRFIELSRQVTTDFSGRHRGQMSAGVFIVSAVKYLASAHNWRQLIFLVKMDKQPSFTYSYQEKDGRRVAIVNEVPNSLNESKSAIQKSALVDASDQFGWDVLAFDRVKKPGLSDYFRGFLGVTERQQDWALTRAAHVQVRKWAKKLAAEQLPPGEDLNTFLGRSLNYLTDHDAFDTDEYLNAVVRDEDADRKEALMNSLRDALAEAGVAGQQFRPQAGSLRKGERKQVYQTYEGVTISFEGSPEAMGMKIEPLGDGRARVTIETNRLDAKG
ncbi:TPA: nucleoid-associated protein [Pseudomonas aeruginosa]|uniref:nucleoid-associated protein n=1 Tax=Pseudomonas aeruginosa TaxID=287 RepID=UPI001F4BC8F5|nr:nucleoid-associated protein [Pseudomonas aeruginosa]MDY1063019.1 nucleoid-associated protein [Pseudomonas aeruginosa]HCF0953893.1 nucleoid-associated protein [Pseudomonas aeruginosa]HEP9114889.1 nucleoid-associated protein [Pseudomonas aeruginosa]HEP9120215.1 nucleoid-associated protein [Pseudomonas aeruginosa]HEP9131484.1 nucleoid-associated protein [Pseudomonas aeruginosa]